MPAKRVKTRKLDIIRCASKFFFERGYSATTPKHVCEELDIYTGNLTYYFPTKEHLLRVFVEMLGDFQWKMMEDEADEGIGSIMAICLELTAMAAMCDENDAAKDFYLTCYCSPMCLAIIRRNDAARAKEVFKDYCPDWNDEQFAEAELLVSGIEYATLMTVGTPIRLETRIAGALNQILSIYQIPEAVRKAKIQKVLAMDYRGIGRRVFKEFRKYIDETNEQALEVLFQARNDER